jgi:transcriptional regulator with XRE-family HTH domain
LDRIENMEVHQMIKKEISEIGSFLRKLRFDQNESQSDMAERLGVSTPFVSLLESKQPITKNTAVKIIQCYNLSGQVKQEFIDMVTRDVVKRFWEN